MYTKHAFVIKTLCQNTGTAAGQLTQNTLHYHIASEVTSLLH
jgi:hypothetical protein